MFNTVLIANRGEIACRAIHTLKRLGVTSVCIYSNLDRNALHVAQADIAIPIAGEKASESYLCIDKIIGAAKQTNAEAIWPGYGFLSENLQFANACEKAGIIFVGPTAQQINEFGLKHRARELASKVGIPMIPGSKLLSSLEDALNTAKILGYPIMLKSTAGGGGIGLKRCTNANELCNAWESVVYLGKQFFNNSGVFIEHCIEHSRHIEVQIFGDGKGTVIDLGERDCSLQRRHQKVIEETPAPNFPQSTRDLMLSLSVRLGQQVNYRSVGTIEYIYDIEHNLFYFLEVNTRLQVEHPVTEYVTGIDLIECMLQVASGDAIDWERLKKKPYGVSIEARLYAENPLKNFSPSPGIITSVSFPENIRVDTGITTGSEVSALYDPMIAKLIVHAENRMDALISLQKALNNTQLHGITNNLDYLRQIVATDAFKNGSLWTGLLENFLPDIHCIEVLRPGTFSSIQDFPGRLGYWNIGVPPSGPMDDFAFRIANRLVGNHECAAGLEFTLIGPSLKFHTDAIIALTGAYCPTDINGETISYWQPIEIKKNQILNVGHVESGCRTYLAIRNGLDVPKYLGSRSTFPFGQIGGHAGRILQIADMLPISQTKILSCSTPHPISDPAHIDYCLIPHYSNNWEIGVLCGPHSAPDFFTKDFIKEFFSNNWYVHHNSNRLGVRLIGPKPTWARANGGEAGLHPSNIHDCEYAIGSINFTGDFPVILTCDGPSLGGFVCPVTIAKAEIWKIGQVKPGDCIRFYPITTTQAIMLEKIQINNIRTLTKVKSYILNSITINKINYNAILKKLQATSNTPEVTYRQAGDKCILIEYGDNVLDIELRLRVYKLMNALYKRNIYGVKELSPGVRSLQIRYNNFILNQHHLINLLLEIETELDNFSQLKIPSRFIWMPISFEDSAIIESIQRYQKTVRKTAPWLPNNVDFIQRINGLDNRKEVYNTFLNATYLVLGLGDVYLGAPCSVAIDPRHRLLSSKYNPARTFTPEGAVGIGGMYMCIYGMDSPGGYQLIGRTLPIWNKFQKNVQFNKKPWLFRFFDQIRFYSVTEKKLTHLREDFREGRANIYIEDTYFDFNKYRNFLARNSQSILNFRNNQFISFKHEMDLWKQENEEYEQNILYQQEEKEIIIKNEREGSISKIYAEINGNIWKILVQPGDIIKEGQIIMVVETMKMELTIISPFNGVVKCINYQLGSYIKPGDILLTLE